MEKLVVLDFGGQYTHLIASRVRNMGVYCEIAPANVSAEDLGDVKGIILSGGPSSVSAEDAVLPDRRIFELGVPVLGICYGHQVVAHVMGGVVRQGEVSEYGPAEVNFFDKRGIFSDLRDLEPVWMSHFDQVVIIPDGFEAVGKTEDCPIAAMVNVEKKIFSVQFHPEVKHTECGAAILNNFIEATGVKREWNVENLVGELIEQLKGKVGDKNVFLMVSGGVDSTVAFLLLSEALGQDRVYGLLVDTGFMRKDEVKEVERSMLKLGFRNLHVRDASNEFFEALKGVYKPEEKRKIIGDMFLKIKDDVAAELKLDDEKWLIGQGTIYPDTIETGGTTNAKKIKTHHNRVAQIQKLIDAGRVIEPLVDFYKDEVRLIGAKLGLSSDLLNRHPFPGPGLAVRCLCSREAMLPEGSSDIEAAINSDLEEHGLKAKILPVKSVGVQGDERTYRHPLLLMGDGLDWDKYASLAVWLINNYRAINRVILCVKPVEIGEINVRERGLTRDRVSLLQEADKVVMDFLHDEGIYDDIWQFATVLAPVELGKNAEEAVVLRPVVSSDAMTANFYEMDRDKLERLASKLIAIDGVGAVFYDLTNKPPGTIEWE